jgi:Tol biopolymer transport system component
VFVSSASNLVPGDTNGREDVFVHDLVTGSTTRVSVSSGGVQGNGSSFDAGISADGRFVVFTSAASNLVSRDSNGAWDVFVHDMVTGTTRRVSVSATGSQDNGASSSPAISADGRFVAFQSDASNLVPGDRNGASDVFRKNIVTGAVRRVSVTNSGGEADAGSYQPAITASGRIVGFLSYADNLVPGYAGSSFGEVYVRDRHTATTSIVSVSTSGAEAVDDYVERPEISGHGRFVVFTARAENLVSPDTNFTWDVFIRDRQSGTTSLVDTSSTGAQANYGAVLGKISAGGRYVTFISTATNLVPGTQNRIQQVYLHDMMTGVTTLVSVSSTGEPGNDYSFEPGISPDGRYVAFPSDASNLVAGDTNSHTDVFARGPLFP